MNTMLSRSGRSNPDGKLVARLDIPVSEELNEAVIAMAAIAGMPKTELVRRMLEELVFGKFPMLQRLSGHTPSNQWEEKR